MTPALLVSFLTFMATGGAILSANHWPALGGCLALAVALIAHIQKGDLAFVMAAQTIGTATGLDRVGEVRVFEQPHTSPNYLMREMIYVVARKHVANLRLIALGGSSIVPWMLMFVLPAHPVSYGVVAVVHLGGALAARWLFFAEAEHVVGLYYGER